AGEQAAAEIKKTGGKVEVHSCDVSRQEQVVRVFNQIGKVDILINNAGIAHIGKADTTPEADFDRVYQVNVKGAYNCLYAAIPLMKQGGGGAVLNLASIASVVGIADRFA